MLGILICPLCRYAINPGEKHTQTKSGGKCDVSFSKSEEPVMKSDNDGNLFFEGDK